MTYYVISTKDEGVEFKHRAKKVWRSLIPFETIIYLSEEVIRDWEFRRLNGVATVDVEYSEFWIWRGLPGGWLEGGEEL